MAERLSREIVIKLTSDLSGATRMETAVNRIQDKVKRVTEAQLKMASASHQASNGMLSMATNTDAVLKSLDRFSPRLARTAYGLTSLVSKIGAVNAGMGVMAASWAGRKVVGSARVGMAFNSNMEVAIERMGAEIRQDNESMRSAMARSKVETGWAMKYAREAKIFSSDTIQHALSDFAVLYRGDMAKARQATQLATLLAAKNPHQGIEGAKIAIQEAESGQWTSPSRRFFLPKNMLEKYKDRGGLGALQATLADMRIGPGLLQAMGNTAPGMEKQLGAMKQQLAGQATTGLYQARKEHLSFVRERMEGLTSEKGALTQISKLTGELGGKLGKMYYGVLEFPVRNADKILGFLKNLKKGLDPMIAVLKAFGKGVYAGFIGPFQMVVRQLQFTGGVMGKIAGIASKFIGMGGKLASSPLYLLAPLAQMLGRGAGTALAGKTVWRASKYVGGPRGLYNLAMKAGPAGKRLWREMGVPLFPGADGLHYGDQANDGVGPNGYEPDDAGKARITQAARKSRRKGGGGGRAPRHKGAQDFAGILADLIENSSVGGMIGGMAGGGLADVLEQQFLNKLGFFDDLAKAGENLSRVVQGVFEGMQGLLSPVNALGAAVGTLIGPFVLLGKILKVVTAPLNSKAGHMIGKAAGMVASPLLMPAMFALGTVGGVNMFKQLGGMVTEGGGAFKKGWTKRVFNSFLMGTDFKDGSRGAQGQHYVGLAGRYMQSGLGMLGNMAGNPRLGRAGPVLQALIGRYSGLIGQGIAGQSPVGAGVEAFTQTGDLLMDRLPPGMRRKVIAGGMRGVNGVVSSEQGRIDGLIRQRNMMAAQGAEKNTLGKLDKEIAFAQRGVHQALALLNGAGGNPATLNGMRGLAAQVKTGLGRKPIEETLQDTIEKMWVKTPVWLSELPVWHREAPNWLIQFGNLMNRGPGGTGGNGGGGGGSNIPFQGPSQRRRRSRGPGQVGGGGGGGGAPTGGAAGLGAGGGNLGGLPLPDSGYQPPLGLMHGPDPAPPTPPGPRPAGGGPRMGGLIGSLSDTFDKVNGWSSALGLKFTGNKSVRRMLVGARRLQRGMDGLPAAGLGILQGAIASSGLGAKVSMANLHGFFGAARTGVQGHLGGMLGGVTGGRANLAGHLSGLGGMLGGVPGLAMGGLSSIHKLISTVLPEMWPILLGGSAIAGITAIAKRVVGKFGELGGGLRGGIGVARAGYQIIDNQLRNTGQKVGSFAGGIGGAGLGMLLASKVPGVMKIPAMLLAGFLGQKFGSQAGGALGGNLGAALPGTILAGLAGLALKKGGGALMAGRGLNSLGGFLGRGMVGAGTIMDLPGTLGAKAFGAFDRRFLGGRYAAARGAALGAGRNALPFLEELAMHGVARGGMVGRLSTQGLRLLSSIETGPGRARSVIPAAEAALRSAAFSRGAAGPAAYRALMAVNAGRAGLASQGAAWNGLLNRNVIHADDAGILKAGGRGVSTIAKLIGGAGRLLFKTTPGKVLLAAAAVTGLAGVGSQASGSTLAQRAGSGGAGMWSRAKGLFNSLGGADTLAQGGAMTLGLGGLMHYTGAMKALQGVGGIAGKLGRGIFGLMGAHAGLGGNVAMKGLLSGGGRMIGKRALMAIPGIGEALGAGMLGWDAGRLAGTHLGWGGSTLDRHVNDLFGGGRNDAELARQNARLQQVMHVSRLKNAGKINAAQAKAMVAEINRSGDDGAKQVGDAAKKVAAMVTTAAFNPFTTAAFNPFTTPMLPGGGAGIPASALPQLGQTFMGPQRPVPTGAKTAAGGTDRLMQAIGGAEGWGIKPDGKGGWAMDKKNAATTAPFGLLGDSVKHPQLLTDPNFLHDYMVGKLTGNVSTRLQGAGISGFSSTVVPGLIGKDGSIDPAKLLALKNKWAPNGVANDPNGKNANWLGNVMRGLGSPQLRGTPSMTPNLSMPGMAGGGGLGITVNVHPNNMNPVDFGRHVGAAVASHPDVKAALRDHTISTISTPAAQKAIVQRTGAPRQ